MPVDTKLPGLVFSAVVGGSCEIAPLQQLRPSLETVVGDFISTAQLVRVIKWDIARRASGLFSSVPCSAFTPRDASLQF